MVSNIGILAQTLHGVTTQKTHLKYKLSIKELVWVLLSLLLLIINPLKVGCLRGSLKYSLEKHNICSD